MGQIRKSLARLFFMSFIIGRAAMAANSMAISLAVHVIQCSLIGIAGAALFAQHPEFLNLSADASPSLGFSSLGSWLAPALIGGEIGAAIAILTFPFLQGPADH